MPKLQRQIRRPASERGFTLIELLVVIIILGVLAAVVVFAVSGVGDKGKSSAVTIDDRTIRTAEEAYCAKNGTYASGQELVDGGFLSELPEYHQVNAQPNQGGPCNGWRFYSLRTGQATAYAAGRFDTMPNSGLVYILSLLRQSDGRVVANGFDGSFNPAARVWDPIANTWSPGETPPFESIDPAGWAVVALEDNPATPQNECKGAVDNCGKVFVRGRFLFDPRKAVGTGQWQTVPSAGSGCNICTNASPGGNYVKLGGTASQCGPHCGKIAIFTVAGASDTGMFDLYDPKDNSYTAVSYPDAQATQAHATGSVASQLPDGRIFICCSSNGSGPYASFFNPASLTFTPAPASLPPAGGDYVHGYGPQPAPRLPNGSVFFGNDGSAPKSTGIYTPQFNGPGTWKTVDSCVPAPGTASPLVCITMGSLPDGRVLGIRSNANEGAENPHEVKVYNPATELWTQNPTGLNDPLSLYAGVALMLDPARGACGANCGKMMVAGWGLTELYTP